MLKLVTCPDSQQPATVECVETPLGHLVHRCTRFEPTCALHCTRECAVALDREAQEPVTGPMHRRDGYWILDHADEDWIP